MIRVALRSLCWRYGNRRSPGHDAVCRQQNPQSRAGALAPVGSTRQTHLPGGSHPGCSGYSRDRDVIVHFCTDCLSVPATPRNTRDCAVRTGVSIVHFCTEGLRCGLNFSLITVGCSSRSLRAQPDDCAIVHMPARSRASCPRRRRCGFDLGQATAVLSAFNPSAGRGVGPRCGAGPGGVSPG